MNSIKNISVWDVHKVMLARSNESPS